MGRGLARDLEARSGGKLGRQYQADYIFNIYYKDRVNFSVVLILNAFPFKRFNFQFIVNNCKVVFSVKIPRGTENWLKMLQRSKTYFGSYINVHIFSNKPLNH